MTESTRTHIQSFIHDLSEIPTTDSLVNLKTELVKCVVFEQLPESLCVLESTETLKALLKQAAILEKESDVQSLCLVHSFIHWEIKGEIVRTPLLLIPCSSSINKATGTITVQLQLEQVEINPFVKHQFQVWSGEEIPSFTHESLSDWVYSVSDRINQLNSAVKLENGFVLGNFHYHRFHVLRELEGINRSASGSLLIEELFGAAVPTPEKLNLSNRTLSPLDPDQIHAVQLFQHNNTVVQGPPGTGKSQIITTLIGQTIEAHLKTLVISEKKIALQVLVKKLAATGLDRFTFVVHAQTRSRDLLEQLKSTWNYLETIPISKKVEIETSSLLISKLQLLLDRLNSTDILGGISFSEFAQIKLETPEKTTVFLSDIPSIKEWLDIRDGVIHLEEKLGDLSLLKGYKPAFFNQLNGDQILHETQLLFQSIQPIIQYDTLEAILEIQTVLSRCQLIENESYTSCNYLLQHPKEWARFEKKVHQYRIFSTENEHLEAEKALWKICPTASELKTLNDLVRHKWKKRRAKKAIQSYLKESTQVDPILALNRMNAIELYEQEHIKHEAYFIGLGFEPELSHLLLAIQFTKHIQSEQDHLLKTVLSWEPEKRKAILQKQADIKAINRLLQLYFFISAESSVAHFLETRISSFQLVLEHHQLIQQLPSFFYKLIEYSTHWKELQAIVLHSNWKLTEARFPQLAQFTGKSLHDLLNQIISEESKEHIQFAEALKSNIKVRFDAYEQLLRKPTTQLSVSEKAKKAQLKRGKSLLIKEFAKSRSHVSIRQLLDSEALPWIQLLLPAWFSTPTQIANHFPLIPELFDAVIFDEASQIQLPNALGALFRSKRALVAGDEQQMAPSQFFGMKIKAHDLLHQASFYLQKSPLKHHYRSHNPQLISFSNTHFYNNELHVYPSPTSGRAIFEHFVPNGCFEQRRNPVEAKAVARWLETADWKKSIGIVAFSEEQLREIWENCSITVQSAINEGIENNRVFFKSLEQVQGDEAATLVISLGYAPNPEGEFHMRFGPLNQANGHKRLNVLLTRAQENIHFFTSVKENLLKLSENEGVNLLRRFLVELEKSEQPNALHFPHQITPKSIDGNQLTLSGIYERIPLANELLTFHQVLVNRGWKLHYI